MESKTGWEPTPLSSATNAYELCEDVIKAITEEPRRYNQGDYGATFTHPVSREFYASLPACGTQACLAGWMVILNGQPVRGMLNHVAHRAMMLLGIDNNSGLLVEVDGDTHDLFSSSIAGCTLRGTHDHVERGVAALRQFMAKHEAHLKATPVVPYANQIL